MRRELTPIQAARLLGVGRIYVYELLASGLLSGHRVMGRWLIPLAEVKRYRQTHPRIGRTIRRRQKSSPVAPVAPSSPLSACNAAQTL